MGSSEIDLFGDILGLLDSMDKARKVDESVVGKLDELADSLSRSEVFWLNNNDAKPVDAFMLFHAFRNLHGISLEAKSRFAVAIAKHENPRTVDDAMKVFPSVFSLFATVKSLEGQPLTPGLRSMIVSRIQMLRGTAAGANMLPSEGENKGTSQPEIREQARALAETAQEILSEA